MKHVVLEKGGMVAKIFTLQPHGKKGVASISVWSFHVLHLAFLRVLSSKDESLRVSASGCVSAVNWLLVQGVTPPSHYNSWERLQQTPGTLSAGMSRS